MNLRGKVALVTGGSRGVGRGVVQALSEAGATVYVTGRTVDRAAFGGTCIPLRCDHTGQRGRCPKVSVRGYRRLVLEEPIDLSAPP